MPRRDSNMELPFPDKPGPSAPRPDAVDAPAEPEAKPPRRRRSVTSEAAPLPVELPAALLGEPAPLVIPEPAGREAWPVRPNLLPESLGRIAAPAVPDKQRILSVGELDRRLKRLVERATEDVQVEGEISGLRIVASGHAYFTLKDEREDACLDVVMYKTAPVRARRLLTDGARVVLEGRVTIYAPRGRLQLSAEDARPAGRGALLEAFEQLKAKLADEGLFALSRKRPLPVDPRVIGVVTSGDGAAIHDILTVAFRRGGVRVLLARAPVQGPTAPQRIARALALLARVSEVEVIVISRGGGSADDLAAYNDEALVRQVAASPVPIVSAVGHEIDVTLTDLAADVRAATPSEAAEMLVADEEARRAALDHQCARLARAIFYRITSERADLDRARAELGSPDRIFAERRQLLDEMSSRLAAQGTKLHATRREGLRRVELRLAARHPVAVLAGARAAVSRLDARLAAATRLRLAACRRGLAGDAGRLHALSPLAVLARGYSIALRDGGRPIHDAGDVAVGEEITLRVHRGVIAAKVIGGDVQQQITESEPAGSPGGRVAAPDPARAHVRRKK